MLFEDVTRDLRLSLRSLVRRPGFAFIVVLTLALGIGANTAIFSVVNAVLLRPLPYQEPDRLVRVFSAFPEDGNLRGTTSPLDLDDWRERSGVFEHIAGHPALSMSGYVLTGGDRPEEIPTSFVTEGFFETMGVPALHGRTLQERDHVEGENQVAVLSHGSFERRFGADPNVVGRTLSLRGQPFTIIGVMPRGFEYPSGQSEIWVPLSLIPETGVPRMRFIRWLNVTARLEPGVSVEQAREEMNSVVRGLAEEFPDSNERLTAVTVSPLQEELIGDVRVAMLTIFGGVGLVLLIACANIANLFLARAEGRGREIALRTALGAGLSRLLRQLLAESVLLSALGGLAGLFVGMVGVEILRASAPVEVPRLSSVRIDFYVLAFTVFVSVVAGVIFGLLPLTRLSTAASPDNLKEGTSGAGSGVAKRRLRSGLVVAEVALVVVLAVGASLLIRSYGRLVRVDPGFDPAGVLTLDIPGQTYKYPGRTRYVAFFAQVLERIQSVPGVESAGIIRPFPLRGDTFRGETVDVSIVGRPEPPPGQEVELAMRFASPDYFRTLRIPLLAGRTFNELDDADHPFALILNQAARERYWPDEDPVGARIQIGDTPATVVGVVGNVRQLGLAEPDAPAYYVNFRQVARVGMTFVVRTAGDPTSLIGAVQEAVWEVDPDQPIEQIATLSQVVSDSVASSRFSMTLLTGFAGLAFLLAAVGIYGVVAHTVSRQTREIGLRFAVGASTLDVVSMVLRRGAALALVGIGIGLAASALLTRLMESILFEVEALDPVSFAASAGVLFLVALSASLVPALRASRVDPMTALRYE